MRLEKAISLCAIVAIACGIVGCTSQVDKNIAAVKDVVGLVVTAPNDQFDMMAEFTMTPSAQGEYTDAEVKDRNELYEKNLDDAFSKYFTADGLLDLRENGYVWKYQTVCVGKNVTLSVKSCDVVKDEGGKYNIVAIGTYVAPDGV